MNGSVEVGRGGIKIQVFQGAVEFHVTGSCINVQIKDVASVEAQLTGSTFKIHVIDGQAVDGHIGGGRIDTQLVAVPGAGNCNVQIFAEVVIDAEAGEFQGCFGELNFQGVAGSGAEHGFSYVIAHKFCNGNRIQTFPGVNHNIAGGPFDFYLFNIRGKI